MAKPAVDGLQRDLAERDIELLRLGVTSRVGNQIARQYSVRGVPTLLVFDPAGEPVLRQVGRVDAEGVLALLETFE